MKTNKDLLLINGLTTKEVEKRQKEQGPNELPQQKKQNVFTIFFRVVAEPMLLLLIAAGVIYMFLGEPKDAIMLSSFVFVVVGITFYQERKTEKTLEALRKLSSPRAVVIRDGKRVRIPGSEVVVGDLLVLSEGDRISADAVLVSCENFSADESMLTGESIPVRKIYWDGKLVKTHPGGDDFPFVYSGSLVVSGHGIAQVSAIGANTEMGKIGKSIEFIKDEKTLLHKETGRIVTIFGFGGAVVCALVVGISILFGGKILESFLAGLTLSMSMLPEEFPVVLIIFLTLGAWRISKNKVLTRKAAAIETLGAATVLCVDKTGTVTMNKSELSGLWSDGDFVEIDGDGKQKISEKFVKLLEYSALASQEEPFDPLEKEIHKKVASHLSLPEYKQENWKIIKEYPLSKELTALSHVWKQRDTEKLVVASKGSPEAIINLCHIKGEEKKKIEKAIEFMAIRGLRILGVARSTVNQKSITEDQHDFNFEFVGLIGFVDPIRSSVERSVQEAYQAGVRIIMITGDYPGTAEYVANKIGLKNPQDFITGEELAMMSEIELQEKIKTINIFARVVPDQKLLIVNALKKNHEIVAMTGDGVNDAPALKAAHIGIAMGERGTDVAREAASLVLLNDDFSSIVAAVRLGRRIYTNLRKAMGYIFAIHFPIAGISLLPILLKLPPVLLPAHIAFLELIIDPACSTVFESEPEEADVMKRPPRNLRQPMFDKKMILKSLFQGGLVMFLVTGIYLLALNLGKSDVDTRTVTFASLVVLNIALITTNLSVRENKLYSIYRHNKPFQLVIITAFIALACTIYIPILNSLFRLDPLHLDDFAIIVGSASIAYGTFETIKKFEYRRNKLRQ